MDTTQSVPLNGTINATFSDAMDPATIIAANFTVMLGVTPVAGAVTYDASSNTATFKPTVTSDRQQHL